MHLRSGVGLRKRHFSSHPKSPQGRPPCCRPDRPTVHEEEVFPEQGQRGINKTSHRQRVQDLQVGLRLRGISTVHQLRAQDHRFDQG